MADDGMRSRATAYVDGEFKQSQQNSLKEHGRQDRRELAFHKAQLQSWERNRDVAELRHAQRIKTIDARQEKAAIAMTARHNSIGGRLAALTRRGRTEQAQEREALAERGDALRMTAHRNLEALKQRQFKGQQADRTKRAQQIKLFRQDYADIRLQQAKMHHQTRDRKIDMRVQTMRASAEQDRTQQQKQDQKQQQKPDTKQDFNQATQGSVKQKFSHASRGRRMG